jgi:hypothetical protein
MDIKLHEKIQGPSRKTIAFLRLFAQNYKELEYGNGEFARMMLG